MATPEHFDFVCLGSGEAGKFLAWTLSSKHGRRCAVVEQQYIGGSCPNIACLPSKNFVHSAQVAHLARGAASYGLGAAAAGALTGVKIEMAPVVGRKEAMVDGLVDMHLGKFADSGAELVRGRGVFVGPKTIKVGDRLLTGETVVICTGSTAFVDSSIPGLVDAKPLTHVDILNLETLPSHLVILGGGYVGLEFAQVFARFGSQVTVIERNSQVLKNEDADVVAELTTLLAREGVQFLTSTSVTSVSGVSGTSDGVVVSVSGEEAARIPASHILCAAGRTPNTTGIGLEEHGIRLTAKGHVHVDEQLRTSIPGVFAVGDCAGSPHFTHVAYDDFRVVLSHITGSARPAGTTGRQEPSVLFTSPELAHVGLREKEAKARGIAYRVAKLPMAAFLRTRTLGEMEGFAKALVEAEGDRILGFTALGPSAGEMLPVVQLAMKLGVPYGELSDLIIVHPTMCEGLGGLFGSVPPRAG